MAHLVTGKHALADELGMTHSQIDKVWKRWRDMPGFPGPAPGFAYVYNADAFRRWLDDASPGTAASTNRQPPATAAKTDWSTRMATAAANVAGDF